VKILLVDDEPDLIKGYSLALRRDGYNVEVVATADEAKDFILSHSTVIAVLDVNLLPSTVILEKKMEQERSGSPIYVEQEGEGFRIAAWIKVHSPATGIVMLTAERTDVADRIQGLDIGADDYIQKGMSYAEFCSRIRAVIRRIAPKAPNVFMLGSLTFDFKSQALSIGEGDISVELTAAEAKLLEKLCLQRGDTLSRSELYQWVFGNIPEKSDRAIDNLVSKIRAKVEVDLGTELPISTIYGAGYKLHA